MAILSLLCMILTRLCAIGRIAFLLKSLQPSPVKEVDLENDFVKSVFDKSGRSWHWHVLLIQASLWRENVCSRQGTNVWPFQGKSDYQWPPVILVNEKRVAARLWSPYTSMETVVALGVLPFGGGGTLYVKAHANAQRKRRLRYLQARLYIRLGTRCRAT